MTIIFRIGRPAISQIKEYIERLYSAYHYSPVNFFLKTCNCDDHWEDSDEKSNARGEQKEFFPPMYSEVKNQLTISSFIVNILIKLLDKESYCSCSNYKGNLQGIPKHFKVRDVMMHSCAWIWHNVSHVKLRCLELDTFTY